MEFAPSHSGIEHYRNLLQTGVNFNDITKRFQIEVIEFKRAAGTLEVSVVEAGRFSDDISEDAILTFKLSQVDRESAIFREIDRDGFRLKMILTPDGAIHVKSVVLE